MCIRDRYSIRVPSRAWLLATLCLAVCAGLGAAWLASRRHAKWLIAPLATLMLAEAWFVGPTVPAPTPLPIRVPPEAVVLDLLRTIRDDGSCLLYTSDAADERSSV